MSSEETVPRTLAYHETAGARTLPAGRIIMIGLIAFGLAALLNADSLYAQASRQPFGWQRTAMRTTVAPVRWISHTTRLNLPRARIESAIGRQPIGEDQPGVTVTTLAASAPAPAVVLRRATAAKPLDLWVGGDSMAQEIGTSVVEAAAERGNIKSDLDYRISTGLTRPDYFNWPLHLQDDVLPTDPEVVVAIFGANDAQPVEIDGKPFKVRTPQWQAEYRRRVGRTMDQLAGNGRLVIWVGMPNMRKAEFSERMQILDEIFSSEAAERPWVRFLDTRPILAPEGAGYGDYLDDQGGDSKLARQSDGIHLSRYGADLVASEVLKVLDDEVLKSAGPAPTAATATTSPATTSTAP